MIDVKIIALLVFGSLFSGLITSYLIKWFRKLGMVGYDVFKKDRPPIPSLGGVPIIFSYIIFLSLMFVLGYVDVDVYSTVVLVSIIAAFIGLLDDIYDLPGFFKPLACMLAGLPIIFFGTYVPRLHFLFGVSYRITYIYVVLILLGVTVSANTVNMFDVINGSALVGTLYSLLVIIISSYWLGRDLNSLYPALLFIAILIGFLPFNIYPSRVFLGNVGSLLLGSQLALFGILYKVEFPTVIAMLPFIHNSFFFLNKVKGFIEHKRLGYRVTFLDDKGLIGDAGDENAPITLIRLLVAPNRLSEKDLLLNINILFIFTTALSLISLFWW